MVQTETKKYTIETLLPLNESYNDKHTLTQQDVDEVNTMVEIIESTRSEIQPKAGDRLIYTDKHGDYTEKGIIGTQCKQNLAVCLNPYIPIVNPAENGISCNISGGLFTCIIEENTKYLGETYNIFMIWGHEGVCSNGGVNFAAKVNKWKYTEPYPLYGNFTTQKWRKLYLNRNNEQDAKYLYTGDGLSFKDDNALQKFLNEYNGTLFPGNFPDQVVVWCYRDELKGISSEEWDAIDAPISIREIDHRHKAVKIRKDEENHTVTSLYISL